MSNEQKMLKANPQYNYNVFASSYEADYDRYARLFELHTQTLRSFEKIGLFEHIDTLSAYHRIYNELGCINKDFITISNDLRRVMSRYAES